MKTSTEFQILFAVPTPFTSSLEVCYGALREHLQFLEKAGAQCLVVNGTTGEFPSLTLSERKRILELCRAQFAGRIINNISACCVSDAGDLLSDSQQFADAILLLPPFYFASASDRGHVDFFSAVLRGAQFPWYLYNFPHHTQNNVSLDLVRMIGETGWLRGVKDSDSLDSAMAIKSANAQLEVFSGDDQLVVEAHSAGLNGIVSGSWNAVPEVLCMVAELTQSGQLARGSALQDLGRHLKQFQRLSAVDWIAAVKLQISTRIHDYPPYVRPPLVTACNQLKDQAEKLVKNILVQYESVRAQCAQD